MNTETCEDIEQLTRAHNTCVKSLAASDKALEQRVAELEAQVAEMMEALAQLTSASRIAA